MPAVSLRFVVRSVPLGVVGALALFVCTSAIAGPYALVIGNASNNVVRIDLETGESSLYGWFEPGALPRSLARREDGTIFASLHGGNRNVVKFVPQEGSDAYTTVDFTEDIGFFGPGELQFHNGDLYVAGDRSRVVFQYDGQTGEEIRNFTVTGSANIWGLAIGGSTLYYSEIFQNTVRKFDLSQEPLVGETLFANASELNESLSMTIGHNGNLFITGRQSPYVQEFDVTTGEFVGTFAVLSDFDPLLTNTRMITYSPLIHGYLVTTGGNHVYRLNLEGELTHTYESPWLLLARGVIVVPEPSTLLLTAIGLVAMLVGRSRRKRYH